MAKTERALALGGEAADGEVVSEPPLTASLAEAVDRVGQPGGRALLVDDDEVVRSAYAAVLQSAGWTVVAEGDAKLAVRRLAVERFDVIVTDLVMPGLGGLDLLRTVREYDLDVPVVIVTGQADLDSAMEAMQYGVFRYLAKPVGSAALLEVAQSARDLHLMAKFKREALSVLQIPHRGFGDRAGLEARLSRALDSLWIAYQPIVALQHRRLVAYEALVRCDEPTLKKPDDLFNTAERLDRLHEVGRRIRVHIASDSRGLRDGELLFVNIHPDDLSDFDLYSASAPLTAMANRVVLELTERASLDRVPSLQARVRKLRALGFRIAIDDLGAGYAGLSSFTLLQPDYVKLDASLIRAIDTSSVKRSIVRAMLKLASGELNLSVIAEAVETPEERDTLASLGADLLQGYLFARPSRGFVEPTW